MKDNNSELNIDFVPPIFLRTLTFIAGVFFLIAIMSALVQPLTNFFHAFSENLINNLNRAGLICEFLGLISIVPDLIEKKDVKTWEKRLSTIKPKVSDNRITFRNLIYTFSLETVTQSGGVLGFVNHASRVLAFLLLNIAYFTLPADFLKTIDGDGLFIGLLVIGYCWLGIEVVYVVIHYEKSKMDLSGLKLLRAASFWFCGGVILFLPILLIAIPVAGLLKWISANSLKTVIGTISFPFILLGTVCQLIASFL